MGDRRAFNRYGTAAFFRQRLEELVLVADFDDELRLVTACQLCGRGLYASGNLPDILYGNFERRDFLNAQG